MLPSGTDLEQEAGTHSEVIGIEVTAIVDIQEAKSVIGKDGDVLCDLEGAAGEKLGSINIIEQKVTTLPVDTEFGRNGDAVAHVRTQAVLILTIVKIEVNILDLAVHTFSAATGTRTENTAQADLIKVGIEIVKFDGLIFGGQEGLVGNLECALQTKAVAIVIGTGIEIDLGKCKEPIYVTFALSKRRHCHRTSSSSCNQLLFHLIFSVLFKSTDFDWGGVWRELLSAS